MPPKLKIKDWVKNNPVDLEEENMPYSRDNTMKGT